MARTNPAISLSQSLAGGSLLKRIEIELNPPVTLSELLRDDVTGYRWWRNGGIVIIDCVVRWHSDRGELRKWGIELWRHVIEGRVT